MMLFVANISAAQEKLPAVMFPTSIEITRMGDRLFAEMVTERLAPELAILEWLRVANDGFPSEATEAKLEALRLAAQNGFRFQAQDLAKELVDILEGDQRKAEVLFWQSRVEREPGRVLSRMRLEFPDSVWTIAAQRFAWWEQARTDGDVPGKSNDEWLKQLQSRLVALDELSPPEWIVWVVGAPQLWAGEWVPFALHVLLAFTFLSMFLYSVLQRHIPYATGILIFATYAYVQMVESQTATYSQTKLQERLSIMATWDGLKPEVPVSSDELDKTVQ